MPTLITRYVPNAIFYKKCAPPAERPRADLKAVILAQIEHAVATLYRHDIKPLDLQILISPLGEVRIIDPALYELFDEGESDFSWKSSHTWFTEDATTHLF